MFRPDVVRSGRAGVIGVAAASYYYSETNVRVTEELLVTINAVLLEACRSHVRGEITSEQYAQVFRDNSARFIALARGYSATPTPEAAAAALQPESDEEGRTALTASISEALERHRASLDAANRAQFENLVVQLRQIVALQWADLRREDPGLSSALDRPREQSTPDAGPRPPLPHLETLRGLFVLFDTGRAVLDAASQERLAEFARATCCNARYVVYGFADATGALDQNLMLSRIRALRVAEALRHHLPTTSIAEIGLGETSAMGADLRDNRLVYVVAVQQGVAGEP